MHIKAGKHGADSTERSKDLRVRIKKKESHPKGLNLDFLSAVMNVSSSELLRVETVTGAEVSTCWYGRAVSSVLE